MPDYDPNLLRQLRSVLGGQTITRGAGLVDNPSLMRTLQSNQPKIMPGANFPRPGAGFMPHKSMPQDIISQGEMGPDELKTLANPNLVKPIPGGNIDPQLELDLPGRPNNDPQNLLKMRLDKMRDRNKDQDYKYQMALAWQKYNSKQEPEQPTFNKPASISPLTPEIIPRQPLATKQIYNAATKMDKSGLKEDAIKARQYNFQTEKFRDAIKDYQLAHTNLEEWVKKNAVPDIDKGLVDLDKLNYNLIKTGHQPLTFLEFKDLSRYELQNKLRKQGADNFYAELKNNLTTMHSELDRIHNLIEQYSGD